MPRSLHLEFSNTLYHDALGWRSPGKISEADDNGLRFLEIPETAIIHYLSYLKIGILPLIVLPPDKRAK